MSESVLQDWVSNLTFMQQSVLLTCIRGCDGLPKYHVSKFILRWYRRCIMKSAFTHGVILYPCLPDGGNFTGPVPEDRWDTLTKDYLGSIDEVPHHFHMHLVHAAEILGYKHPLKEIRPWWLKFYEDAIRDLHATPETEEQLDYRLGDSRAQWLEVGREELK